MNVLEENLSSIIKGSLEILEQGENLLLNLTDEQYQYKPTEHMSSSIGEHFRHILDLFNAVIKGQSIAWVDYDVRTRGGALEQDRAEALSVLANLKCWVTSLGVEDFADAVVVKSEVCLSTCESIECQSTFIRELAFVGMHMVHHLALIKVIASLQGIVLDKNFGMAPATATFLRGSEECAR